MNGCRHEEVVVDPNAVTVEEDVKLLEESDDGAENNEVLDPQIQSLVASILPASFDIDMETQVDLDRESKGKYTSTGKKLQGCRQIPLAFVWKEFAPFFDYRWNKKFRDFAALFLAIWERESKFALPKKGVLVSANCENRKAKVVHSLRGTSLKKDLKSAKVKEKALKKIFDGCNMNIADYGPLQWNHRWRLSQSPYRPHMEKALRLSTKYRKKDIAKLGKKDLALLVKYNSRALFLLGGLSLKETSSQPVRTIAQYNTDDDYRSMVARRTADIKKLLSHDKSCRVSVEKIPKKKKR